MRLFLKRGKVKSKFFIGLLFLTLLATPLVGCAGELPKEEGKPAPVTPAPPSEVEKAIPAPPPPEILAKERFYLPEIPRITSEELKQLMDNGADVVLVDTRLEISFKAGHLKGAINIPATPLPPRTEEMIKKELLMLPRDKLIVLYCD
jgi:hypothetical protein